MGAEPEHRRGKRRLRPWSRARSQPFVDRSGECAICLRELTVKSEDELTTSGWLVQGETGLCPECQRLGWTLPEGAELPIRGTTETPAS
jgi:hypothetical protein